MWYNACSKPNGWTGTTWTWVWTFGSVYHDMEVSAEFLLSLNSNQYIADGHSGLVSLTDFIKSWSCKIGRFGIIQRFSRLSNFGGIRKPQAHIRNLRDLTIRRFVDIQTAPGSCSKHYGQVSCFKRMTHLRRIFVFQKTAKMNVFYEYILLCQIRHIWYNLWEKSYLLDTWNVWLISISVSTTPLEGLKYTSVNYNVSVIHQCHIAPHKASNWNRF